MRLLPAACILTLACALPAQADIFNLGPDSNNPTTPSTPQPAAAPRPAATPTPARGPAPRFAPAAEPQAAPASEPPAATAAPETYPAADESSSAAGRAASGSLLPLGIAASIATFLAALVLGYYGQRPAKDWMRRQEDHFDQVLRQDLLLDIRPRTALALTLTGATMAAMLSGAYLGIPGAVGAGVVALFAPGWIMKYLIEKRLAHLNIQLVDGLTSLSSGVRAGLNLVQSMQLLVRNSRGPIQQEFGQILREYDMGMDLNQAMRHAANRIRSPLYRLTFTAIEMHRIRGGDSGESMDRIAEAVREIQRLEGKLDAVTSQSRAQANMLTFMPLIIIGILGFIAPEQIGLLFSSGPGKITLVIAVGAILLARKWIHEIMQVDI